jgi:hypothetical protein
MVEGFEPLVGSARAGDMREDSSEDEFVVARLTPEAFARLIERIAAGDVAPPRPAAGAGRGRPMPRQRGGDGPKV